MLLELPDPVRRRLELQPLLFGTLKRAGRLDLLAAEEVVLARRTYFDTLGSNLRALGRARQVLDAAEMVGVTLMPLKGACFAEALYEDPGMRPMSDVDLVVHPEELDRAAKLMREIGFEPTYPVRARFKPRHAHDISFYDKGTSLCIELHYRLFHELGGDASVERLFERSIAIELYGRERRALGWDDHLFVAAVHAATHAFGHTPIWLFDVALLMERTGGGDGARSEAERRGYGPAFRLALKIAREALPAMVPACARYRERLGDRLREQILGLMLGDPLACAPVQWRSLLARSVLTEDPRRAVAEVVRKLGLHVVELGEAARRRSSAQASKTPTAR